jgi:hypothetical protein
MNAIMAQQNKRKERSNYKWTQTKRKLMKELRTNKNQYKGEAIETNKKT